MQKGLIEDAIKCLRDLDAEYYLQDPELARAKRDMRLQLVLNSMLTMICELDKRLKEIEDKL